MQPDSNTTPHPADDEDVKHGALGHLSVDEELQQTVCEALIENGQLDSSGIGVRVSQGAVVLSGSVESREAWRRALRIAKRQAGVTSVQADDLHIRDT